MKNSLKIFSFVLLILLSIGGSFNAFADAKEETRNVTLTIKDNLISLHTNNASFKDVLRELAKKTGIKVEIFEGVDDKNISLNINSLPIRAVSIILKKMSLENYAVVYDKKSSLQTIYVLPKGKNIAEITKGKTVIRSANFESGRPITHIKNREVVSDVRGKNKPQLKYVKDEALLKFHLGVSKKEIEGILKKHNLKEVTDGPLSKIRYIKVRVTDDRDVKDVIKEIRKEHKLKVPELNYVSNILTVTDPFYKDQWYIPDTTFDKAWEATSSTNIVNVAVIDTGVNSKHPDLKGKILEGYDFVNNDKNASDDHGHGTFISGIISAAANDIGIKGLYDYARIIPVKVIDENGFGTYEDVAKGIIYAADAGATVINLSVGGNGYSSMLQDAVDYALEKGCIVVAAGGNDGVEQEIYPAAYPNVIGVSALGYNGQVWDSSNSGRHIDISAPGAYIISTGLNGDYVYASGTSASAAMVSALTAMLDSEKVDLSSSYIGRLISQTAKDIGERGKDKIYGSGEIDALEALKKKVKPFHDIAVKGVSIEPTIFEKGKSTNIIANIENTGTHKSEKFDVVFYEIIGEEKKKLGRKKDLL